MRKQRGLTQAQVAQAMGVSQARVSRMEHGDVERMQVESIAAYVTAVGGHLRPGRRLRSGHDDIHRLHRGAHRVSGDDGRASEPLQGDGPVSGPLGANPGKSVRSGGGARRWRALRGVSSMVEQRTFNPASLSAVLTCKDPDHRRAQALKSGALIFDALAGVNTGLLDVLRVVQLEHGSDRP